MCVGVPMQLIAVEGICGTAIEDGVETLIDLSLTPEAAVGDWVLGFLGAARGVIDAQEAAQILAALGGLRALMAGGDLGAAFADLEARAPTLPPHLQAAFDAGKANA